MRRLSRQRYGFLFLMLASLTTVAAIGQSQSLGDIARANREKKAAEESSSTPPKVITNSNLPKDTDANAEGGAATATPTPKANSPFSDKTAAPSPAEQMSAQDPSSGPRSVGEKPKQQRSAEQRSTRQQLAERQTAQQRASQQRAAAQWKKRILQQEITVANLRMRVDQFGASMHLANVNTHDDMPFDRYQAQQIQRLRQLQHQLEEQRRKLEDMQEAARHAGMHTLVYDP